MSLWLNSMTTEQNIYFGIWFGVFFILVYFHRFWGELFGGIWRNPDKTFIDMLILTTGIFIVCAMIYDCVRWGSIADWDDTDY